MPRTDTRERIIRASLGLMRQRGYAATAVSDIVRESKAPRGSVSFHFPEGKAEIAAEVIKLMTQDIVDQIDASSKEATSASEVLERQIDAIGDRLSISGWSSGCPVAPLAIELAASADEVRQEAAAFFHTWRTQLALRLSAHELDADSAGRVAALAVYAIEGAIVAAKAEQTLDPLTLVASELARLCHQ